MAFKIPFKKSSSSLSNWQDKFSYDNDFLEAINLFKTQRKKEGISLDELSNQTKISRNVLIAIENGCKKYLPETTYLISMIKSLEIKLNLEKGSLNGLLSKQVHVNNISEFKFNFINIDFLNSWIGSIVYFILMLLSILALNSQQKYLLKLNSVSTEPILIEDSDLKKENIINSQNKN
tara:strand:- start:84 stop:617 length:534 start_codon:yes stop_codon:yes gene_type:complete